MQVARNQPSHAGGDDDGNALSNAGRRALLLAAVTDACAAVTRGVLSNTANLTCHPTAPDNTAAESSVGCNGYISAATRLQNLTTGTAQLRRLLSEYEAAALETVTQESQCVVPAAVLAAAKLSSTTRPNDGAESTATTVAAVRASVNGKRFAEECELALPLSELRPEQPSGTKSGPKGTPVMTSLQQLLQHVRELRHAAGFSYESTLRDRDGAESGAHNGHDTAPTQLSLIVKRLEEAVTACTELLRDVAASPTLPASSASSVRAIATWPASLLRLLHETAERPSLQTATEAMEEKLRRIQFDVEELAQAQEQAVTDGDMHRSEELYFQQAELLEAMKPHFATLEHLITSYRVDAVERPRGQLQEVQAQLRSTTQEVMGKEGQRKRRAEDDLQKLNAKRDAVAQLRDAQRAGLQLYTTEWTRVFDDNVRQQGSCLKAMEELERRLKCLADEQNFLVQDRLEKLRQERQRADDAEAFSCFVEQRGALLRGTLATVERALSAMREMSSAVEFSCDHLHTYLRDVLEAHTEAELLRARQARLAQFRELYLTLGDLHFKKARHAEEIVKKVEYYSLQQEIAMDTLNSRAKEYSQAKKKWQAVHDEINAQIHSLEQRSEREVADFRPTEQLLLQAGVRFTHPQDELTERNLSRTMKLLEYKKLMEEKVSESAPDAQGGNEEGAMTGTLDHAAMEEELRQIRRAHATAPCLQSTEDFSNGVSSATRRRKA